LTAQTPTTPMAIATAQKSSYHAQRAAGITQGQGIHTLRHCFAPHGAPGVGRAEDRAPRWEVADIWRRSGDAYRAAPPVPLAPPKVMHALVVCRTAPRGGHTAGCPNGGCERDASTSCRHRPGPQCQTWTKGQWGEARKAEGGGLCPLSTWFFPDHMPATRSSWPPRDASCGSCAAPRARRAPRVGTATAVGRSGARWSGTPGTRPWERLAMSPASARQVRALPMVRAGSLPIPASSARCGRCVPSCVGNASTRWRRAVRARPCPALRSLPTGPLGRPSTPRLAQRYAQEGGV
jgi:hypothetical protein